MDLNGVGWLTAIIVGALAGWIAEKLMKSDMGLFGNIILGIIGAAVLNFILALLDIQIGYGWIAYLVAGIVGACALIGVTRAVRGR